VVAYIRGEHQLGETFGFILSLTFGEDGRTLLQYTALTLDLDSGARKIGSGRHALIQTRGDTEKQEIRYTAEGLFIEQDTLWTGINRREERRL